jgi:DNA polymerase elongation subunit (family B)
MMVPKYGERLKYVIVQGTGPIKNRAIPLFEYMLYKNRYRLDLDYYYSNLFLPPLRRALISLVNLDEWGTVNQYRRDPAVKE